MQEKNREIHPLKKRLFEFIESQGLMKNKLFESAGLSPRAFYGKDAKSDLGSVKVSNVLKCYPQISPEWLLTGEGEMLRDARAESEAKEAYKQLADAERRASEAEAEAKKAYKLLAEERKRR